MSIIVNCTVSVIKGIGYCIALFCCVFLLLAYFFLPEANAHPAGVVPTREATLSDRRYNQPHVRRYDATSFLLRMQILQQEEKEAIQQLEQLIQLKQGKEDGNGINLYNNKTKRTIANSTE